MAVQYKKSSIKGLIGLASATQLQELIWRVDGVCDGKEPSPDEFVLVTLDDGYGHVSVKPAITTEDVVFYSLYELWIMTVYDHRITYLMSRNATTVDLANWVVKN